MNDMKMCRAVAELWVPNKKGYRYVRDESKPGIVSKMVLR